MGQDGPAENQVEGDAPVSVAKKTSVRVGCAIVAAFLLFVLSVSLLFYRYVTVHEPDTGIYFTGNSALAGATITVRSKHANRPYETQLNPHNRYHARFYLGAGTYEVEVTAGDGEVIYRGEVDLYADYPINIDLTRFRPDTRPS